jgi:hypothetical protein
MEYRQDKAILKCLYVDAEKGQTQVDSINQLFDECYEIG